MLKKIIQLIKSFFKTCTNGWVEYSKMEHDRYISGYYVRSRPTFITEKPEPVPNLITVEEIRASLRRNNPKYRKRVLPLITRPHFFVTRELVIDKIMEEL